MELVKTLVERLAGVTLPKDLFMRLEGIEYRILEITDRGVHYEYGSKRTTTMFKEWLHPKDHSELLVKGFREETCKKVVGPDVKYVFLCGYS